MTIAKSTQSLIDRANAAKRAYDDLVERNRRQRPWQDEWAGQAVDARDDLERKRLHALEAVALDVGVEIL